MRFFPMKNAAYYNKYAKKKIITSTIDILLYNSNEIKYYNSINGFYLEIFIFFLLFIKL